MSEEKKFTDDDIQRIMSNLVLFKLLEQNEKLSISRRNIENNNLLTSIRRTCTNWYSYYILREESQDTRESTLDFIKKTFSDARSLIDHYNNLASENDEYHKNICMKIIGMIKEALLKLTTLKETYKHDKNFVANIESQIVLITSHLETINCKKE